MTWIPEEEIEQLEAERHRYAATFSHTDPNDTVTRAHLQHEMDWRTRRIQQLQEQRPLGWGARLALRGAALAAAWAAWQVDPLWATITLGLLAAFLAFLSLG
ncbi:hypothetical protein FNQ90_25360 [Streptomyces alkaliphilus]|uniref:DUF3040 domain-containing protein n=1 Tax=Streptomyces alkaliphilus TaxID=1472722 RepID=A0A7W3Y3Z4_9ACTN|nr:hypothetical protein [Streptomyces alkaliphilus]MBB0247359.1 hypothetical protein [Streptomyces alkaliphilus]